MKTSYSLKHAKGDTGEGCKAKNLPDSVIVMSSGTHSPILVKVKDIIIQFELMGLDITKVIKSWYNDTYRTPATGTVITMTQTSLTE